MLDLSDEGTVRRIVARYVEKHGTTYGPYHFDAERAVQASLFFPRHLQLTKGEWARRPFVLSEWQAVDIIIPAFGWYCEDGTRRFRRVRIWVPRKNGKTELLGGVGLIHLMCDGEFGGEVYSIATKEDQARIVFDVAKNMVRRSDFLRGQIKPFADSLWCDAFSSVWMPLSGIPKGSHGKGPSALLGDETHEWDDDRLYKFLADGMGARLQPMDWQISTAGEQTGYGWEEYNVNLDMVRGVIEDPRTLVAMYGADPKDDWKDPAVWRKANPNFGVSLKPEFLEDQFGKAQRLIRYENDFKRYHLNLWVGQAERWLRIEDWDRGGTWRVGEQKLWLTRWKAFKGRKCFVGVDMASVQDLCAVVFLFPPAPGRPKWDVLVKFYMPSDDLAERVKLWRVPLDQWADEGALILTPGNAADHLQIEKDLREAIEFFEVQAIGFDPWNSTSMMISINTDHPGESGDGIAVKVQQTMLGVSGAAKTLERQVLAGDIDHGGHPVLRWQASNVAIVKDEKENIMPAKKKSAQKIDGIAALVTAEAVASGYEIEKKVTSVSTGYMRRAS